MDGFGESLKYLFIILFLGGMAFAGVLYGLFRLVKWLV